MSTQEVQQWTAPVYELELQHGSERSETISGANLIGYEQRVYDDPKRRIETRLKPHLEGCIRQDDKPIVLEFSTR